MFMSLLQLGFFPKILWLDHSFNTLPFIHTIVHTLFYCSYNHIPNMILHIILLFIQLKGISLILKYFSFRYPWDGPTYIKHFYHGSMSSTWTWGCRLMRKDWLLLSCKFWVSASRSINTIFCKPFIYTQCTFHFQISKFYSFNHSSKTTEFLLILAASYCFISNSDNTFSFLALHPPLNSKRNSGCTGLNPIIDKTSWNLYFC